MQSNNHITISIDSNTIFRVLLVILGSLFLYYIGDVLVIIFVSFIIVSAITPLVDFLERFYLPRSLVVLAIYAIIGASLFYLLSLIIPAIGEQIKQLANNMPSYSQGIINWQEKFQHFVGNKIEGSPENSSFLLKLGTQLNDNWWGIFSQAGSFITGIINFIAVISLSFYLSIQKKSVGAYLRAIIPSRHRDYAVLLMERIQHKMGQWLVGQMALNIIVGVFVYIGLTILGIPYALLLAIIAATFEVIPYVGPITSAIPGILIALSVSPIKAVIVLLMYIVIQQLESHLFVPLVMRQAVGLNSVVVIIAILIGIKVAGPLGAILAIPLTAAISVFLSDFVETEKT